MIIVHNYEVQCDISIHVFNTMCNDKIMIISISITSSIQLLSDGNIQNLLLANLNYSINCYYL